MFAARTYRRNFFLASVIFIISLAASVSSNNFFWMLLPFVWVIAPPLFQYTVTNTSWLFTAILILLPLSAEFNVTDSLGLDLPDEILLMLLTGTCIIKWIHQPNWIPASLTKHPLFLLLFLYLIWIAVCCIYSTNPLLSVKFLLAKTWYIFPFVLLPQLLLRSKTAIKKMALCLLLPMGFVVAQSLMRHSFYHFSFEGVKEILSPFFRNHVIYSAMLVCLLTVLWCVIKLTPKANPYLKWLYIAMVLGLTGLLFSYSRGAWVAMIFGIAGGVIIYKKIAGRILLLAILTITISIGWLSYNNHYLRFVPDYNHTIFHKDFGEHLEATVTLKDVSDAERFYRWIAGAKMVASKPITGFGPNNFYDNYKGYTAGVFKTWVSNNPDHSSVHNYFLLTALEQGIPGLVLFLVLFGAMLLYTQKLYHQLKDRFYKMIALTVGVLLVMIATVNFLSDLVETDKIGSLFWLSLGMIILLDEKLREENSEPLTK